MSIASELEALKRSNGLIVVEDAERWARANTQSALYHALEWDDESAAQQFRFWQIRQLIAIHVINEVGQRQLISLSVDRVNRDGGGYRGVQDVLSVPNLRAIMLQDALTELERVQKKYDGIVELARVWEEAETVRRRSRRRGRRAA